MGSTFFLEVYYPQEEMKILHCYLHCRIQQQYFILRFTNMVKPLCVAQLFLNFYVNDIMSGAVTLTPHCK